MEHEIEKLKHQLDEWRATHKAPTPFPVKFWTKAVSIAEQHGACATAKALLIDYSTLRRKIKEANPTIKADFVELFQPMQTQCSVLDCVIEIQSSRGSRLRLEANSLPVSELVAIVRDFRD